MNKLEPHHEQPIWVYWEGEMSPVIQLCIETMERHFGDQLHLVGPEEIRRLGGEHVLDRAEGLFLPYRSDLIRLWLIKHFGGIWVDADTVVVNRPPVEFLEAAKVDDLVGVYNPNAKAGWGVGGMLATPFGAKKGSPAIEFCYNKVLDIIQDRKTNGTRIVYGSTSVGVLCAAYKKFNQELSITRFHHWKLNRVPWQKVDLFNKPCNPHHFKSHVASHNNVCFYHLTNKITANWKEKTRDQILASNTFLA